VHEDEDVHEYEYEYEYEYQYLHLTRGGEGVGIPLVPPKSVYLRCAGAQALALQHLD
jgi:hypothetical protein